MSYDRKRYALKLIISRWCENIPLKVDKAEIKGYYIYVMKKMLESVKIEKLRGDADINKGCVVAVGNFDGVHMGHRMLIETLVSEAAKHSVPSAVFTFFEEDRPKMDVKMLSQYGSKSFLLSGMFVDLLISAPFGLFRDMEAEDFVESFLMGFLNVKCVICGYDFRFGRGRKGDAELIKKLLSPYGVEVISADALVDGNAPISSTVIRALISEGDVEKANVMLGRPFSFKAPVSFGAQIGRTLGFPTANQKYPSELVTPAFGVYAVWCLLDGEVYGGVSNFGVKPTVGGIPEPICETFIFGFEGNCYGKEMTVAFRKFIRKEMCFGSLDELKAQIELDKKTAEQIYYEGVNL